MFSDSSKKRAWDSSKGVLELLVEYEPYGIWYLDVVRIFLYTCLRPTDQNQLRNNWRPQRRCYKIIRIRTHLPQWKHKNLLGSNSDNPKQHQFPHPATCSNLPTWIHPMKNLLHIPHFTCFSTCIFRKYVVLSNYSLRSIRSICTHVNIPIPVQTPVLGIINACIPTRKAMQYRRKTCIYS